MTQNILILDLETRRSADDCAWCQCPKDGHAVGTLRCLPFEAHPTYAPIGWEDFRLLGLSIGCYWDCQVGKPAFFDIKTYRTMLKSWIETQPMLVTFNGKQFDIPLLEMLYRIDEDTSDSPYDMLTSPHYDILDEIWKVDPVGKTIRGLNSLGALAKANGLPSKSMDGATAPHLWSQGRYADVINYCLGDVLLTKALFELVLAGEPIKRAGGRDVLLPRPFTPHLNVDLPPDPTSVHLAQARGD